MLIVVKGVQSVGGLVCFTLWPFTSKYKLYTGLALYLCLSCLAVLYLSNFIHVLIVAGFMRPVVIYGGVSDIAQDRLIREVSDLFAAPPSSLDREDEEVSKSGIIKV